ncbi:SHOCT domain-containing protein [Aneurinibacillus thermoaerophilus]|uniref:SHOCT domain-containing protein n=1 Tax=Aneurinibacillus thermoaerophilus TaxID=143495 RepID=A0ABX8YET5_ANETH|nr:MULTISPECIES: SHOCT domain-containing protein [Aneurinibacillus]MED0676061.1 SHOCT domain-containing protein [Aneurinibacillus thermoaerophilus]MED0681120.1 SHOCT domain-containing protein [Aneurinibacillus thermoaerophilus]MED0758437.1 SHOCT domain-containing protein [Aneurinibacillus thermoaerophilus]MED0759593.1 SHOCT domain-containing protein [Aneurinibacillus thermoaerophilus]MED0765152.1 SHOCT domain-containing protein [Aneurinibacillus thermoaerophilus]
MESLAEGKSSIEHAIHIAGERFAKGEISEKEYERILNRLREDEK